MANREKHTRDLVRDWTEGNDNTIPTRARSSRIIGSYTKNRRTDSRRRPSALLFEEELLRSGLQPMAANAPSQSPLPLIPARLHGRLGRRQAREPRRELRRKPQGQRCGFCC